MNWFRRVFGPTDYGKQIGNQNHNYRAIRQMKLRRENGDDIMVDFVAPQLYRRQSDGPQTMGVQSLRVTYIEETGSFVPEFIIDDNGVVTLNLKAAADNDFTLSDAGIYNQNGGLIKWYVGDGPRHIVTNVVVLGRRHNDDIEKYKVHPSSIIIHFDNLENDFGVMVNANQDMSFVVALKKAEDKHKHGLSSSNDIDRFVDHPNFTKDALRRTFAFMGKDKGEQNGVVE
jgi:hypothetical protein